jgi:hypothetical protein
MPPRSRNYSTDYQRRQARAKAMGWTGYRQRRYWTPKMTDAFVKHLAEKIGGPVEPDRGDSLMSAKANRIVNPHNRDRRPLDWRVRLLRAAGEIS